MEMKEIQGTLVLETLEEIADPKHTALLVIDVQNDNSSPKGFMASQGRDISWIREVIPRIKMVLEEARRLGLLVIFVRMTRSKDGRYESAPMLRLREKSAFLRDATEYEIEGTWGHEVLDELEPKVNERQINKYCPSAFMGTPLNLVLTSRGIRAVAIVGLRTEVCVESTVRDMAQHGYHPVLLHDCVCSSRQDLHEAALLVMSDQYDVITSEELLEIWHSADEIKI